MSARRGVAEDLVGAVRKEAVGEVAKGVVKGVKAALIAALGAICALVWSLWTANPVATVALAVASLAFGMAVGAAAGWRRAVSAKDAEISRLKNARRAHGALFDAFLELTHGEQLQIVSVWLSEPGGLAPTDDQRAQMGGWVAMKRFVRHDPVTDRLHLRDGAGEMLLENPQHVYDLMAARVADLEVELTSRPRREDVEEGDATISSLEEELERRPTIEEVDARVVEAIGVFVDAATATRDELSKTSDDRLRDRMASGQVSGFEARVLGEVLALDVPARRWLRTARDEGFVDVEDRDLDLDDRFGHFRNLVTAAETGLAGKWGHPVTRYVLNDGVREALEALPGAFDVVDEEDRQVAELAEAWNGTPYDPGTARYRRVSRSEGPDAAEADEGGATT